MPAVDSSIFEISPRRSSYLGARAQRGVEVIHGWESFNFVGRAILRVITLAGTALRLSGTSNHHSWSTTRIARTYNIPYWLFYNRVAGVDVQARVVHLRQRGKSFYTDKHPCACVCELKKETTRLLTLFRISHNVRDFYFSLFLWFFSAQEVSMSHYSVKLPQKSPRQFVPFYIHLMLDKRSWNIISTQYPSIFSSLSRSLPADVPAIMLYCSYKRT